MSLKEYVEYNQILDLRKAIEAGNIFHAYILEGGRGVDTGELAKALIKAVLHKTAVGRTGEALCRRIDNGNYLDLYEVYPATEGTVKTEQIGELIRNLSRASLDGNYKFAVIYEADKLSEEAQNKFLKTLEEPTPHTVIILLCHNVNNLLPTIKSRCIHVSAGDSFDRGCEAEQNSQYAQLAEEIFSMVREKSYFYKIKEKLDKGTGSRDGAMKFLDAFEVMVGERLLKDSLSQVEKEIKAVEDARRSILENVNYKYALRAMILKIGG